MKNIFIIILFIFASSCKKEYSTEYSLYEYESYISSLISNKDTLEFTSNFIQNLIELRIIFWRKFEKLKNLKNLGLITEEEFSDKKKELLKQI